MDEELEKLHTNIKLLQAIHFEGMNPAARKNLTDSINQIEAEYERAMAIADDKSASEARQKYGKELGEVIAKSVPDIVISRG
jgi:hypothetical protein